jgi:phage terminase large subunit-like protein
VSLAALRRAASAATRVSSARERRGVGDIDWLIDQWRFLTCADRAKLLRAGNQTIGKTTVGLSECIMHALGTHPVHPWRGPRVIWVITASWSQSLAIQQKLWALLPKDAITDRTRNGYSAKHGFGNHNPMAEFVNGSIIQIKTAKQDALDLASATVHHVLFDEPPKYERVFNECVKRLTATNGTYSLTITPINAPTDYIREKAEKGEIRDFHVPLTPQSQIHHRSGQVRRLVDGTVCDAAWVAQVREETPEHEAPVTVDGEWETRSVGRMFTRFLVAPHPAGHLMAHLGALPDEVDLMLGIDHSKLAASQAAVLVAVERVRTGYPRIWAIDEYCPDRETTAEQDADALIDMLARHGWTWGDLDEVWGDIPSGSGRADPARKGNRDIEDALARRLRVRTRDELPVRIRTAKRGEGAAVGSVTQGIRYLTQQMVRGNFLVHPRCAALIRGLSQWEGRRGDKKDEAVKHPIDALRYGLRSVILRGEGRATYTSPLVRVR